MATEMKTKKTEPIKFDHEVAKAKGVGGLCEICGCVYKKTLLEHHISYEPKLTINICASCHIWLHGHGPVMNHKFKRDFAKLNKGWAPYVFALAVCRAYEAKLQEYVAGTLRTISGITH